MKKIDFKELFRAIRLIIWHAFSRNFWYKLLSVAIACFLWSYVITSNPSITRDKTINDVDVALSGQSVLANRGFALLTDLTVAPLTARVRVAIPQSRYTFVTESNVRVELDLSSIRRTGKQQVKLRGTSSYGTVSQVTPEYIEVEIDYHDERDVPVNVVPVGDKDENYWYNLERARINPSYITVKGPASLVQRASTARVTLDLTGHTSTNSRVEVPMILDAQGAELPTILTKSTNSVTVGVDIYPQKLLPVSTDLNEVFTGDLPEGFLFEDPIEIQPKYIMVAAEQSLLDSLDEVDIVPIDVSNVTSFINRNASVNKLKDVKNYSSDTVTVKMDVIERVIDRPFNNLSASLINLNKELQAKWSNPRLSVMVTGDYTVVQGLNYRDLVATVNLGEVTKPGSYLLPIQLNISSYPELGWSITPEVVTVTVTKK